MQINKKNIERHLKYKIFFGKQQVAVDSDSKTAKNFLATSEL